MKKTKVTRKPASRSHEAATVESFRRDRKLAAAYLDQVLAEGDQEELMLGLRRLSEAFGGVTGLAHQAGLNSTTLYRDDVKQRQPGTTHAARVACGDRPATLGVPGGVAPQYVKAGSPLELP